MATRDEDRNPYAPPRPVLDEPERGRAGRGQPSDEPTNAWTENELVVMPRFGAELPDRCVVCNRPTTYKLKRTFQWHNPAYYFLVCAGWIVYLIVLLIVRKTATVYLGLCEAHEARRKNGLYILWGGLVAGLFFVFLGTSARTPLIMLIAVIGMTIAIFVGAMQARVVTVKKIDETHLYLVTGAPFMLSLPTSPEDERPPPPPRKKKKKRVKRPAEDASSKSAVEDGPSKSAVDDREDDAES